MAVAEASFSTEKDSKGDGVRVSYSGSFSAKHNYRTMDVMNAREFTDYINTTYPQKANLLGTADTDWQKEIYRIGLSTDHNVSVMAGKKLPVRFSLGYNYDQGTLKVGDASRYNADLNLSPKFFGDHLQLNVNLKGIYSTITYGDSGAIGNAIAFNPTMPVYREDGTLKQTGTEDFTPERWNKQTHTRFVYTWDGERRNKGGQRWFEFEGRFITDDPKAFKKYMQARYADAALVEIRTR